MNTPSSTRFSVVPVLATAVLAATVLLGSPSTAGAVGCSGDCCQLGDGGCKNVSPCDSTTCTIPGSGNTCHVGKQCLSSGLCSAAVAEGLESFSAERGPEGIRVRWTIASDLSAARFNVHRAPESFRPFEVVNATPIEAEAGRTEYEYLDPDVAAGTTFFYLVEAMTADGGATLHGLIEVRGDGTVTMPPLPASAPTADSEVEPDA